MPQFGYELWYKCMLILHVIRIHELFHLGRQWSTFVLRSIQEWVSWWWPICHEFVITVDLEVCSARQPRISAGQNITHVQISECLALYICNHSMGGVCMCGCTLCLAHIICYISPQTMNPDVYRGPWGGANCRESIAQPLRSCDCVPGESGDVTVCVWICDTT